MCVCVNMSVVCEYIHGRSSGDLSANVPSRNFEMYMYMCESCVEIEDYSVAYFICIAAFKAPYH